MGDAFYAADGDSFVPTDWTRGPWDARFQHAGPPAALVGRAVEALDPQAGMVVARFTLEVLRPIRLTPLRVQADAVRSGRRVQFVQASLSDGDGEVARAGAWRIRPADPDVPPAGEDGVTFARPEESPVAPAFDPWRGPSYFSAMEWRLARGTFMDPGPATVWMRMRIPLVDGEDPSPLTRVLVAADSGNGISMELPIDRFVFINTELSVHLIRMPGDPWVCLDSRTRIDPSGIGLAESTLWDPSGRLGRASQSLLVAPR